MSKLQELNKLGQSVWLDYIRRQFIEDGSLQEAVNRGVRGITSNPAIFSKAIAGSDDYDNAMKPLVEAGKSVEEIYEALVIEDIQNAADILRPVYDESNGADGYVSLEVNPHLALDTQGTIEEAQHLFATVNRPNVMIKIPATKEGIPAITEVIGDGVNVNVTLMFSLDHYDAVAEAYITGLEKLDASGGDVSKVASVASFFVSRVESAVDDALEEIGNTELQGEIAVANARAAYQRFLETFSGDRWDALAAKGAKVQRPLWASTSTKNPAYRDTKYVDELIGADTVNTMPPETLEAFADHGTVAVTIDAFEDAQAKLDALKETSVDLDAITEQLQEDGVDKFSKPFDDLLDSIKEKSRVLQQQ